MTMLPNWRRAIYLQKCPRALAHRDQIAGQPTTDNPLFSRMSGLVHCSHCGHEFYQHPDHPHHQSLTVACTGELVKL